MWTGTSCQLLHQSCFIVGFVFGFFWFHLILSYAIKRLMSVLTSLWVNNKEQTPPTMERSPQRRLNVCVIAAQLSYFNSQSWNDSSTKVRVRENSTRGIFVILLSKQPLSFIYMFQQIGCDGWESKELYLRLSLLSLLFCLMLWRQIINLFSPKWQANIKKICSKWYVYYGGSNWHSVIWNLESAEFRSYRSWFRSSHLLWATLFRHIQEQLNRSDD